MLGCVAFGLVPSVLGAEHLAYKSSQLPHVAACLRLFPLLFRISKEIGRVLFRAVLQIQGRGFLAIASSKEHFEKHFRRAQCEIFSRVPFY